MKSIQKFSYHSHTTFSDGADTLEDMVAQAKRIGFTELGITDHLIVHKNMKQSPSQPYIQKRPCQHIYNSEFKPLVPAFQKHCEHIRNVSSKENFKLYVGFEVDYFPYDGWLDEFREFLSQLDYDYVISGNHFLFDEKCECVFDIGDLIKIYPDKTWYPDFVKRHFKSMKEAVESGVFKFLAHIDYIRRMGNGVCNAETYSEEKIAVLDSLREHNIGIELSTKGLRKIGDYYPSGNILSEIAVRNLPVVISDDAHKTEELGYAFADAEQILSDYNITNRIKF